MFFEATLRRMTASEIELKPEPEHVGSILQAAGAVLDRVRKIGVKPERIEFYVFVPVPVHPQLGRQRLVRPEIRISEARGEDLLAQAQLAYAPDQLPAPGPMGAPFVVGTSGRNG